MQSLDTCNPIAAAVYFLLTAGIAMFSMNPVILVLSLVGALLFHFFKYGFKNPKSHLFSLALFAVMALINPLTTHNGATVLFVMNDKPVTLEALIYGIAAAAMIISVLYWFRSFTEIMTSDKLLYLFGALSPKLALILSMALRFVPLFGGQIKKTEQSQKALGLYKEDNLTDTFKGKLKVFGIIITWGLENGIITADSMTARGYGTGKRSHFSVFVWNFRDVCLLLLTVLFFFITLFGLKNTEFTYYPNFYLSAPSPEALMGYISYGLMVLLPTIFEAKELLKWKYLKSKI